MTYRDERQSLVPSAKKILENIEDLNDAIAARIKSDDGWTDEHIEELNALRKDLLDWDIKLRRLIHNNW